MEMDGVDDKSGDLEALGDASVKLLPVFFRIVSSPPSTQEKVPPSDKMDVENESSLTSTARDHAAHIQSMSKAITSLVKFAPIPIVQNLFKKLMHRLLESIQSGSEDSERTCSLLNLSQALIASKVLDVENVAFFYRVLKPILKDDECGPRVQKRAYKVLAEICEQYHSWVAEPHRLKELTALLTDTVMTSQVSARYMRLKCIGTILEGFDEAALEQLVRFVLIDFQTALGFLRSSLLSFTTAAGDIQSVGRNPYVLERFEC